MEKDELERLVEVEQREKSNSKRIDNLESKVENIHELASSVKLLASETKAMREDVNKIDSRLKDVEDKPAKRWEGLIKLILTGVATALIGYFLAKIGL